MQKSYGARCIKMGNRFHIPANPDKNAGKNWHRGRFVRWKYEACVRREIRLPKPGKTCIGKAILLL